jgi:hypothetical protein
MDKKAKAQEKRSRRSKRKQDGASGSAFVPQDHFDETTRQDDDPGQHVLD